MRQQQSFRGGLIGGLAMLCLASAQLACQPRAPEHSDVLPTTAAQHAPEAGGGQVHWTYDGETGAARWGELDPSFAVCAEGAQQSPVDLASPIPAGTGTLDIQWQPAEAYVVDNGHTIQVDVAEGSSITLEGRRFSLLQFHFHLPSEHMVDGDGFPMEVHFVHQPRRGISRWSGSSWAPARAIRRSRGSGARSRDPASRPRPSRNWIRARCCQRDRAISATPAP